MSPFIVIGCILAIVALGVLCFYYKNRIDDLSVSNGILKRRNDTLEEKFETMDAVPANKAIHAQDFLLAMGRKHQFEVEEINRDDEWITNVFTYQGGRFVCFTGANDSELMLYFRRMAVLPYTPENYEKVRTICSRMTDNYRHGKVVYEYDDAENKLYIETRIGTIYPTEDAFMYFLGFSFKVREQLERELNSSAQMTEEEYLDNTREE